MIELRLLFWRLEFLLLERLCLIWVSGSMMGEGERSYEALCVSYGEKGVGLGPKQKLRRR